MRATGRTADVEVIADALDAARRETLRLLAPLPDDALTRQVSTLMSPLVWDAAHIGWFEELWIARRVGGLEPMYGVHDELYDAFRHARADRAKLPILEPRLAFAYIADVRARTLEVLEAADVEGGDDSLLQDGFVFGLVLQHELQHQETMLQTLSLSDHAYDAPLPRALAESGAPEATVPAGDFVMGAEEEPWAYDNEREPHELELAAFAIDRFPVSNEDFAAFVADGYADRRWWTVEGWAWRIDEAARAPMHWWRVGSGWQRRRFGRTEPLDPAAPVEHISWFEADAYARWAGKRLPTEQEWERAAKAGVLGAAGAVWEWTSGRFLPYPGFMAFPYAEYSEVFFGGDFRVLRGGSWATDQLIARPTFRNWDHPRRRQLFAGVRLARDA